MISVYIIKIPEYNVRSKPDSINIGAKIDVVLKKHFNGKKFVIRGISSTDHKNKNIGELIK